MEPINDTSFRIQVKNAGVVLANNYFPMLFERAGLLVDKTFSGPEQQQMAIALLNYLVWGQCNLEGALLPLNKLLCGVSLSSTVSLPESLSSEQKGLTEGLLHAMIGHWREIGDCSIDGFRGNWLVRDGLLTETTDYWQLVVEKRGYDVLLQKAPFSFSIIRFPWMEKPLHVSWGY